jgi:hypothetical protein
LVTAKDVPPGGAGEIKVTFESKGYQGEVRKVVTVESNDPENPTVRLTLKGTIVSDVTVTPQAINLGTIRKGQPVQPSLLTIRLKEGKGLKVEEVSTDSPAVRLKKQKETAGELVYEVGLTEKAAIGRVYGQISVVTNNKKAPKILVPFHGIIQGNVKITPQLVSFGMVQPGQKATQTIYVAKDADVPFTVRHVTTSSPQVSAEVIEVEQGGKYEIRLTYDPGDRREGRINEKVTVVVNDPHEEVLEVPLYGMINPQSVKKPQ